MDARAALAAAGISGKDADTCLLHLRRQLQEPEVTQALQRCLGADSSRAALVLLASAVNE